MKNTLVRFMLVGAVASVSSLTTEVKAIPITGQVDFQGVVSSDNGDLTLATLLNAFTGVTVGVGSGNFASSVSSAVTHQSFVFSPNSVSVATPILDFWSYTHNGRTYSFDLQSLSISPGGDATHLGLEGSGIVHETGFDDTAATWSLAATSQGLPTFTFAESTTVSLVSVPDAATTLGLLVGGLATLGLLKRRMGVAV